MRQITYEERVCAYLLRLELGRGQLPGAFEAEQRSLPGLGDLLHLVSGRTLLGVVRERITNRLGAPPDPPFLGVVHKRASCRLDAPPGPPFLVGAEQQQQQRLFSDSQADDGTSPEGGDSVEGPGSREQHQREAGAPQDRPRGEEEEEGGHQDVRRANLGEDAQVLEMLVDEELVAVAVRHKQPAKSGSHPNGAAHDGSKAHSKAAAASQGWSSRAAGAQSRQEQAAESTGATSGGADGAWSVRVYDAEGSLLSEERQGLLRAPGKAVAFSIVRSATPLVRHLYFVAETGAATLLPSRAPYGQA